MKVAEVIIHIEDRMLKLLIVSTGNDICIADYAIIEHFQSTTWKP